MCWIASGSRKIRPTRMRGSSEAYGSWNINWKSRRFARNALRDSFVMSSPSISMEPESLHFERRDEASDRRLATARLADQSKRLTLAHAEGHVRHRVYLCAVLASEEAPADGELLDEVRQR